MELKIKFIVLVHYLTLVCFNMHRSFFQSSLISCALSFFLIKLDLDLLGGDGDPGYFQDSKVQITNARPMKTLDLVACVPHQASTGRKCVVVSGCHISGCCDYQLARQALNHSRFLQFVFIALRCC